MVVIRQHFRISTAVYPDIQSHIYLQSMLVLMQILSTLDKNIELENDRKSVGGGTKSRLYTHI